jgi:hypothetical protein
MPRNDYARCRECDRPSIEVGPLSHTRLCTTCATERLAENVYGIHEKAGPAYLRRQYGIARAEFGPRVALALKQAGLFDGAALDDVTPNP